MQETTVTLLAPASGAASNESAATAISWPSIIGGALAMTALSLIFLIFGGALGLTPSAPPDTGRAAWVFTSIAAIWLIITQWLASAIGGYLTGRLRTKWVATHTHEVFFRDTAHGFLAWATATVFVALVLTSTFSSALGHTQRMSGGTAMRSREAETGPMALYVDGLYRSNVALNPASPRSATVATPAPPSEEGVPVEGTESTLAPGPVPTASAAIRMMPDVRAETSRLLLKNLGQDALTSEDKAYLAQLVTIHTGLSQGDAVQRVDNVLTQEKADAQKMRKSVGYLSLFTALSMLIGAFVASAAAAFGGSQRDEWEEAVRNGTYKN